MPSLLTLLILCASFLVTACGPSDGESREFHKTWQSGRTRAQGIEIYSDDEWRMDGEVSFFHDDGRPAAEGSYAAGLETGHWSRWLEDGTRVEGSFEAGQRIGAWTFWNEDGSKQEEGQYVDGQRTGRWTWWYSSGGSHEVNEYQANKVHGYRISFKEDGSLDRAHCGIFSEGFRTGPLPEDFDVEDWLKE